MEYTVGELSRIARVSTRTLRYYDREGLLSPARTSDSGYRVYGPAQVDRLQQILFYRELEFSLKEIAGLLAQKDYEPLGALRRHREGLMAKKERIDMLIKTVDKTIAAKERGIFMNDNEKFKGFIEETIALNEEKYGAEVRRKYGNEAADASNERLRSAHPGDYKRAEETGERILSLLDTAFEKNDAACAEAGEMAALHKEWLTFFLPEYSKETHESLCDMYVADERFAEYYNRGTLGRAEFFRDAVKGWLKAQSR
ncbi:MAG: MerR family transcriptional regulator [Oscillospiraceae bacterium]|nr:MerR family transcriptional regulator [Oscillospiraceae bacterium]